MNSDKPAWEEIRDQYLKQIEKAMGRADRAQRIQVLDDVRGHLDQRYNELAPDERTQAQFQAIIEEMGPASDYGELLERADGFSRVGRRKGRWPLIVVVGLLVIGMAVFVSLRQERKSTVELGFEPLGEGDLPETSRIDDRGHIVDRVNYPFINDANVLGVWEGIDVVQAIDAFKPGQKSFSGKIFLKELFFLPEGKTSWAYTWTKGLLMHRGDQTASKYTLRRIGAAEYLFLEWKDGDYIVRHRKPFYCVLQRGEDRPYVESRLVDILDHPFINDANALGAWECVDYVEKCEDFDPTRRQWPGALSFEGISILPKGKTNGTFTWTRGLLLHAGDQTASHYVLKEIDGVCYLFFAWKGGDYTRWRMTPKYYVLTKVQASAVPETRIADRIDFPFVDDPRVVGAWESVDVVDTAEEYRPGRTYGQGGSLLLKELVFSPQGAMSVAGLTWTRGLVLDKGNITASRYMIKELEGDTYMFYEWKDGDYIYRGRDPKFYVLKKR